MRSLGLHVVVEPAASLQDVERAVIIPNALLAIDAPAMYSLLTTHYLLLTTYYSLPLFDYSLLTTHYPGGGA